MWSALTPMTTGTRFVGCVSACDIKEFVKTRAIIMEKIAEDRPERERVMLRVVRSCPEKLL
jgi:hypothetical protein